MEHISHLEMIREIYLLPFLCLKVVHMYGISHCLVPSAFRRLRAPRVTWLWSAVSAESRLTTERVKP